MADMVTHETAATNLGTTLVSRPTCVMTHSSYFIYHFTPEDYYNVSSHEFGHCLGLGHIVDNRPADDLMASIYAPDVGAADNPLLCVSTLNMRAVERSYGYLDGQVGVLGEAMGTMHTAGADFAMKRPNDLSVSGWRPLFNSCAARSSNAAVIGSPISLAYRTARY